MITHSFHYNIFVTKYNSSEKKSIYLKSNYENKLKLPSSHKLDDVECHRQRHSTQAYISN